MNSKLVYGLILSQILILSAIPLSDAESYSLMVSTSSTKPSYTVNENPLISGKVTDSQNNPISDAKVKITSSDRISWTATDSSGEFSLMEEKITLPGFYVLNILVTKGTEAGVVTVVYEINDSELPKEEIIDVVPVQNKILEDPLKATLLLQAEKIQKDIAEQEKKQKELEDKQRFIEEQRKNAYDELVKDLGRWDAENLKYAPRNAFAAFLTHVDEGVHAIYWAQFTLTEKISDEAHKAKLKAIEDGMSREEALKVFHEEAAISRDEITEYNTNVQIDLGVAQKDVQKKFNVKGKIPREG